MRNFVCRTDHIHKAWHFLEILIRCIKQALLKFGHFGKINFVGGKVGRLCNLFLRQAILPRPIFQG